MALSESNFSALASSAAPTPPQRIRRIAPAAMVVGIEGWSALHAVVGNRGRVERSGTRLPAPVSLGRCGMDDPAGLACAYFPSGVRNSGTRSRQ
jgi:hypothetical protein